MTNKDVLDQVSHGFRHPKPMDVRDEIYEVMLECWKDAPQRRPTFDALKAIMEDLENATKTQYEEQEEKEVNEMTVEDPETPPATACCCGLFNKNKKSWSRG